MEIPTRIIEGLTMAEQYAAEAEREAAEIHRLGDRTSFGRSPNTFTAYSRNLRGSRVGC